MIIDHDHTFISHQRHGSTAENDNGEFCCVCVCSRCIFICTVDMLYAY